MVAIGLVALISGLALLGMSTTAQTWAQATLKGGIGAPRGGLLGILTMPARLLERAVVPALNYVEHELSKAASHYMHPIARWLDGIGHEARSAIVATGLLAEATAHAFERETHVVIPRAIRRETRPISRRATAALGAAAATAAALARYRHGIDRLLRDKVEPQLRRLERATTQTIPRELGRIRARARALERELTHPSTAALRRLAARLWVLGIAGLVVRALARRFPWLFCRKVSTLGKRVCGLDQDLLNALMFETLLLTGTINLETLAKQCQGIARIGEAAIQDLIE